MSKMATGYTPEQLEKNGIIFSDWGKKQRNWAEGWGGEGVEGRHSKDYERDITLTKTAFLFSDAAQVKLTPIHCSWNVTIKTYT